MASFYVCFFLPPPPTSSCFSHHTKHSVRVAAAWAPMLYKSSPSLLLLPTAKTKKLVCMLSTCSYTPGQFISVQIKTTCAKKFFLKANMCSLPYVKISSYCFQKNCSICLIGDIMLSWESHWHNVVMRKWRDSCNVCVTGDSPCMYVCFEIGDSDCMYVVGLVTVTASMLHDRWLWLHVCCVTGDCDCMYAAQLVTVTACMLYNWWL